MVGSEERRRVVDWSVTGNGTILDIYHDHLQDEYMPRDGILYWTYPYNFALVKQIHRYGQYVGFPLIYRSSNNLPFPSRVFSSLKAHPRVIPTFRAAWKRASIDCESLMARTPVSMIVKETGPLTETANGSRGILARTTFTRICDSLCTSRLSHIYIFPHRIQLPLFNICCRSTRRLYPTTTLRNSYITRSCPSSATYIGSRRSSLISWRVWAPSFLVPFATLPSNTGS
jgi:hypothetical protein